MPTEKAADVAVEQVDGRREVHLPRVVGQPELGDVGDQDLAGGGGREVVQVAAGVDQQQVGRRRAALLAGVGAVAGRPRGAGAQPLLGHDPAHHLLGDRHRPRRVEPRRAAGPLRRAGAPRELGADAAVAVGAPGRLEGGPDQGPQGGVRVGRGGRRQAVVERAARQGQRRQRRPQPEAPPEPVSQRRPLRRRQGGQVGAWVFF